jgi:hypothetical protein
MAGDRAERTRQEWFSRDGSGEVKMSGFASEPRRVGRRTWQPAVELRPPACGQAAVMHTCGQRPGTV